MTTQPRIDIIHMRDPDSECDLEVYVDGQLYGYKYNQETKKWDRVGGELHVHSFDPGAGYDMDEFEETRDEHVKNSPDFLKDRIAGIYDEMEPAYKKWSY